MNLVNILIWQDALSWAPLKLIHYHIEDIEIFVTSCGQWRNRYYGIFRAVPIFLTRGSHLYYSYTIHNGQAQTGSKMSWYNIRRWRMLEMCNDLLLYNSRIVAAKPLQQFTMEQIYHAHQGIQWCQEHAQCCVWWLGISSHIQDEIQRCLTCPKKIIARKQPCIDQLASLTCVAENWN